MKLTFSIKDIISKTPYKSLECIDRPDIYLKLECNQFANSFKARGVVNFLSNFENVKGLVTFTTGNHGIAVAEIAKVLHIPAIIITNDKISNYKRAIIENTGATVRQVDFYDLDKSTALTKEIAYEFGYSFVPLYDNDNLLEGYSEIANEICTDFKDVKTMYFPIGSGSLLFANAKKVKAINPNIKVIGVEPILYQRLNGDAHFNNPSFSIADSLAIDRIPICNLELIKYADKIIAIDEKGIVEATKVIYERFNLVTEAGGAITLAAALNSKKDSRLKMAIITGKNTSTIDI
jgi:threonine dehydratase